MGNNAFRDEEATSDRDYNNIPMPRVNELIGIRIREIRRRGLYQNMTFEPLHPRTMLALLDKLLEVV